MTQMTLEEQLQRVEANADSLWLISAKDAVTEVAERLNNFTTDAVWAELREHAPREPRAMGTVMRWAVKEKLVSSTGQYEASKRKQCNHRPVMIYRSLLI